MDEPLEASRFRFAGLERSERLSEADFAKCRAVSRKCEAVYRDYLDRRKSGRLPDRFGLSVWWDQLVEHRENTWIRSFLYMNYLRLTHDHSGFLPAVWRRSEDVGNDRPRLQAIFEALRENDEAALREKLHEGRNLGNELRPVLRDYLDHIRTVPDRYRVRVPLIYGEMGLEYDGILVNDMSLTVQSRVNALHAQQILNWIDHASRAKGPVTILEIGAGHGAMAQAFRQFFPGHVRYIIVDLPHVMVSSALYLGRLVGWDGVHVLSEGEKVPRDADVCIVPFHLIEGFRDQIDDVTLAVNTMSFFEMTEPQLRFYAGWLRDLLSPGAGVLYEENCVTSPNHLDVPAVLARYFAHRRDIVDRGRPPFRHGCQRLWYN